MLINLFGTREGAKPSACYFALPMATKSNVKAKTKAMKAKTKERKAMSSKKAKTNVKISHGAWVLIRTKVAARQNAKSIQCNTFQFNTVHKLQDGLN